MCTADGMTTLYMVMQIRYTMSVKALKANMEKSSGDIFLTVKKKPIYVYMMMIS